MVTRDVSSASKGGFVGFLRTVRTVAWAFVGLRNRSAHQDDFKQVKPIHVIVVGVLGALALVLALLWVVNTVLGV